MAVTGFSWKIMGFRPTIIAIHDDGNMLRHF
jgi:hypothetical protein